MDAYAGGVELIPTGQSDQRFRPPRATPLAALVDNITFYTHGGVAHVEAQALGGRRRDRDAHPDQQLSGDVRTSPTGPPMRRASASASRSTSTGFGSS